MECRFIVDGDLLARFDIAQSNEEDVAVDNLHEGVGLAGVVDVMRPITAAAAVEAPAIIDCADAQSFAAGSAICLGVCNLLACIFRYLPAAPELGL